jgi:hypothetical protein
MLFTEQSTTLLWNRELLKKEFTMVTIQIFKKSFSLVWRHRSLWLFGVLLALTVNSALWLGLAGNNEGVAENCIIITNEAIIKFPGQGLTIDFRQPGAPDVRIEGVGPGWYRNLTKDSSISDIWALLISIGILVLIGILLTTLLRYTSQASLIRMVDENERSGKMVGVGQGLRLGWSWVALKLFLIDLAISLPMILFFTLLFCLAISPFFLFGLKGISESLVGVLSVSFLVLVGLGLFFLLIIAASTILSITRPVMRQACVVDGLGVGASIRQGFVLLKTRFNRVFITWLTWLAVRIAWTFAIIPAFILLSPVILLSMLGGIVIGAIPTVLVAGIANQFVSTVFAWIIGAVFGLPLFVLVTFSPIIFLSGLVEVFISSFWTLSYREFHPQVSMAQQPTNNPELVRLNAVLDP